jgi:ankyrin repeat protein
VRKWTCHEVEILFRVKQRSVALIVLLCCGCHRYASHGYTDDPRLTPLMNAARHNDLARVRTLLANGANVKAKTAQGETALYEAIERELNANNLPVVDALLRAGADPDEREIYGASALSISLTRDYANPVVTMRLLRAGAHVSHDCGDGDSLLSLATQESSPEVMRELIQRGAPVNCRYRGASALYWAAINGETDKVKLLLESGADPTIQVDGKTLLEAATCTNPDRRVQANFEQTRRLIRASFQSTSSSK